VALQPRLNPCPSAAFAAKETNPMFGLFIIEAGSEPVALLSGDDNKPVVFETGAEAADMVRAVANGSFFSKDGWVPLKVQPRRLSSDAWKARELGRFADGIYTALPWADLPSSSLTAEHFAHISTEDGAKIAYTQDAAKGQGDIQTRVRPGKYLTQYYSEVFDAPTIARMAAEFSNQYGESNVLLFADTADEIERVYVDGPHSCMAKPARDFDSSIHPCRIYAAGDLAVAYMVRKDEITARALVWPEKKIYGRIYGDETRLLDLLDTADYREGSLNGARMLRIPDSGGFVCPYIDGVMSAEDSGEFLIIGDGDVCGSNQKGLSGSKYTCEECSGSVDVDDCSSDYDGNIYCQHCYHDLFGYCEHSEETCRRAGMQEVIVRCDSLGRHVRQHWGAYAIDNNAFSCEGTGDLYAYDMRVELADGTNWSQEYFEDHGSICEGNGKCYANDDMVQLEDGTLWSKDWFADNGVTVDDELYAKGDEPGTADPDDVEASDYLVAA
jgi:hypothetical protein